MISHIMDKLLPFTRVRAFSALRHVLVQQVFPQAVSRYAWHLGEWVRWPSVLLEVVAQHVLVLAQPR